MLREMRGAVQPSDTVASGLHGPVNYDANA